MKILVTGSAGFIGSKLAYELGKMGNEVVGIDNFNDYYSVDLKHARTKHFGLDVLNLDIADKPALDSLFANEKFDLVVNLAAQAGVRNSIINPYDYLKSNIAGFLNILEACRNNSVEHLVFASSSSVYGLNDKVPFSEEDKVATPVSLYAASKISDENMAHAYAKLYGIKCIGLRFFTVYGPWGRPDMAPMLFAKSICNGKPIKVFNNGDMLRDFTYIDDVVEGTKTVIEKRENCFVEGEVPFNVFNIGRSFPIKLMDFIGELETALGKSAEKIFMPMQPGDVYQTYADTSKLTAAVGYMPRWDLHEGISEFVKWYLDCAKNFH